MTIELVLSCVLWLNIFSRKQGISYKMSPMTSIKGLTINYNKHHKLQMRYYVQNHESHKNITGTARTIGALSLIPTRNDQVGYYFCSLRTDRTIN